MLKAAKPRVLHIITGLGTGGAEMMLSKLLRSTRNSVESCVISLMDRGPLFEQIESLGVPVYCLGLARGTLPGPMAVGRLLRLTKKFAPSIIQGWMYHGNLAALLASSVWPQAFVYWNIRQTLYGLHLEGQMTRRIIRLGAWLSRAPEKIIYNSRVSAGQHEAAGYSATHGVVVPNGFDLGIFCPDPLARSSVRAEFGLPADAQLVGHVARFHPMKGHARLLDAAKTVVAQNPGVIFLLVGADVSEANGELAARVAALDLQRNVILAGERHDVPRLTAALDIAVSASGWGEGFPNVVGESMATGVPCVVTDVGDSAWVVGDFGRVVRPDDAAQLAHAIVELLALDRESLTRLGTLGRERVERLFSLERIGAAYFELYCTAGRA